MKIVVIADKPSAIREWAHTARIVFPEIDVERSLSLKIHPYYERIFAFPKHLKASDFPFSGAPSFNTIDLGARSAYHGTHGEISSHKVADFDGTPIPIGHSEILARLREADVIIDGVDAWPSDQAMFDLVWNQVFGDGSEDKIAAPFLTSYSSDAMVAALAVASRERGRSRVAHLVRYGRSKWRFQYGFTINANAVLRPLQRSAGVASDAPPLSPFSLQLLYALKNSGPLSESKIVELMSYWTGSGRYPRQREGFTRMTQFGSPASRSLIIRNLQLAQLVTSGATEPVEVSPLGNRLLELLHPDCQDPDLSFRLDEWFKLPELEAQVKVDRYLRTFFGKQMRFQGGLSIA
jgi:hypothetical protein